MKKLLLFILCSALAMAASYTDTLDADFSAGNSTQVNATNDSILLRNATLTAYNTSGVFTSQIFDLGSNPVNTTINWSYATSAGTSVLVSTRSGNSTSNFTSWTSWSSSYSTSTGSTITSTRNRYYQYQVTLTTTDNTTTPIVTDVTLNYVENGTEIYLASGTTNVTSGSSGNQSILVSINDTYAVVEAVVAYRYDNESSGSYSTATNLTYVSGTTYSISVPQPSAGWYYYRYGNLTLQVNATTNNGSANTTTTATLREPIEFVNTAPVVDPISNTTINQNGTLNITVTASDYDNQSLTFTTNASYVTVTTLTTASARLTWSPNATQTGLTTFIVYANDTFTTGSRQFSVNVTDTNDAPTISSVSAITGYHGERIVITLTGYDLDLGANLTFSMYPPFFSFTTTTTTGNNSATYGTFYGVANTTPADEEHGTTNVTFYLTDGTATANTSTTVTVTWCGDLTCDATRESATSCAIDCNQPVELDQIALIVPDRNCVNTAMSVRTFNASNRFSCYYQGLVEQGFALCEGLDSVAIKVYYRNGTKLTEKTTLTSGSNGTVSYTPTEVGEYKFTATIEDFSNTSSLVYVRSCDQDITIDTQNTTIEQPPAPPDTTSPQRPQEELPTLTTEEIRWFQVLIFYILVPLLLASMLYTSVIFYDVNKDTLPWLLESRIFLYEKRLQYAPQLKKVERVLAPVYEPVKESLLALYTNGLKPFIDKLKKRGK